MPATKYLVTPPPKMSADRRMYVRKKPSEGGFYTYKEKVDAAAKYVATGNLSLVAKLTGINRNTLLNWKQSPWWEELLTDLAVQEKVETNQTLKKLRKKALEEIEDRLKNGNAQFDQKSGKLRRIPVSARDAHRIASDLIDKEEILQNSIRRLTQKDEEKSVDNLKLLAEAFAKMANTVSQQKAAKTIDVEDAVILNEE